MGRVFGIHELELRPGASAAEFEQLIQEYAALPQLPGTRLSILRANRGVREGKYLMFMEAENVATRDRYWPDGVELSDEAKAFEAAQAEHSRLMERLGQLLEDAHPYTDYEVIAEST
jgi:hypothetical protein